MTNICIYLSVDKCCKHITISARLEEKVSGLDRGLGWVGVEVARLAASHRSDSDLTSEFALIHEGRHNGSIVPFSVRTISPIVMFYIPPAS